MCILVYVYMWVYTYVSACMYVECICVRGYVHVSSCIWLCVTAFRIRSDDPNSVTENLDLYLFGTQYHRDSKIDPWNDP